ncbi:MAG: sel1 repeat family protein [Alphaproteobacteria bacterium]|nr:sel1 repeat family protein [Alphaproteobacteria bacterium]
MLKTRKLFLSISLLSGLLSFNATAIETTGKDLSYADFMIRSYYEIPSDRYKILEIPLEELNLDDPEILFILAEAHYAASHRDVNQKTEHTKKAFKYYTQAAEKGHASSWGRLAGKLYGEGATFQEVYPYHRKSQELQGIDPDSAAAATPCRASFEDLRKCFKTLGDYVEHLIKLRCTQNSEKFAPRHYERLKEAWRVLEGIDEDTAEARLLFYKGLCLEKGLGTSKDLKKAETLYEKAFKKGMVKAAYRVAILCNDKNKTKAQYYLDKSCTQGFRKSCVARYCNQPLVDEFLYTFDEKSLKCLKE